MAQEPPEEKPWKNLVVVTDREGNANLLAHSLQDQYWRGRIGKAKEHTDEPELWYVLDKFADKNTLFIDGGANIGLWSATAAAKIGNPSQVIAVDPSSATMPQLEQNAALNGNSFTIVPKALWNKSGEQLPFNEYSDLNPINSLHAMSKSRTPSVNHITTVTVDDLVDEAIKKESAIDKVIIKLDVEKSEFEALQGAAKALKEKNALVVYEDHRVEYPDSELTQRIIAHGMNVYYVDPEDRVRRIASHEELKPIKVPPRNGYNFLACMPESGFDRELAALSQRHSQPSPDGKLFLR